MNARALFVGADGRPWALWRLVLFLLISLACGIAVTISLKPVLGGLDRVSGLTGTEQAYEMTFALLLAHWLTLRTFDKRPWSSVWLHEEAASPRVLLTGAVLGAVPIGIVSLLLVGVGLLAIRPAPDGSSLKVALQTLMLLLPAAFLEELLSRGYLFATLREWLGSRTAVIVTSVGFGLLHLFNPHVSVMSIVLVTLAGVYLAVVLLATQSLYAAWIAHFAWNWMMAGLLHVPVSGLPLSSPDYQIVDAGPDWITGGQWGPEGGAAAGLGIFGGMAYLYWRSRQRRRPVLTDREVNISTTNELN